MGYNIYLQRLNMLRANEVKSEVILEELPITTQELEEVIVTPEAPDSPDVSEDLIPELPQDLEPVEDTTKNIEITETIIPKEEEVIVNEKISKPKKIKNSEK